MFIISKLTDNVRVHPADMNLPRAEAITNELNKKYSNKVLHDVGLCVRVLDLVTVGDGVVFACQDGSYMSKVSFRLIVFRPLIGEVLIGKVLSTSPLGIRVSLNFFDEITIPAAWQKDNSHYDASEGTWIWKYEDEGEVAELFVDTGEQIRFRIETETFYDIGPAKSVQAEAIRQQPYSLTGSIVEQGLGPLAWWE